jgi:hypothetical protein
MPVIAPGRYHTGPIGETLASGRQRRPGYGCEG